MHFIVFSIWPGFSDPLSLGGGYSCYVCSRSLLLLHPFSNARRHSAKAPIRHEKGLVLMLKDGKKDQLHSPTNSDTRLTGPTKKHAFLYIEAQGVCIIRALHPCLRKICNSAFTQNNTFLVCFYLFFWRGGVYYYIGTTIE